MNKLFVIILGLLVALISFQCKPAYYFEFSHLPQSVYLQSISLLLISLFLLKTVFQKNTEIRLLPIYLPILAFLIWAFISLFWCTNPSEGLPIGLNWLAAAIIFFIICNALQDATEIKWLLLTNLLPALFIIVVGLSQTLELSWVSYYPQIVAPAVTFGNKNMMVDAFISLLPSVLLLGLFNTRQLYLQIIGFMLFGLGITLIVLSDTRAGMLAVMIQLMFLMILGFIFRKKLELGFNKKLFSISIPIVLILFFSLIHFKNEKIRSSGIGQEISFQQFSDRLLTIFKTKDEDKWALQKGNQDDPLNVISDSRTMRLVTWKNTLIMFLDKPITGFGLYNWQIHYGEYRNAWLNDPVYRPGMGLYQVHNDYLQILVDLGLPGILLALVIFLFNIRSFLKILKFGSEDVVKMTFIIGMSMIGILVVSAFSFPFERSVPVAMYFVFTAILAWLEFHVSPPKTSRIKNISKSIAVILGCIFLIAFIFLVNYQDRRMQAEVEFKSANDQYALGNFELAVQHCKRTLELTPYRHTAELLLGYSYLNLNQTKLAEEALLKGLQYYPNDLISLLQLGTTYTKLTMEAFAKEKKKSKEVEDLLAKSETWFQKTLAIRADFHTVYYNKGVLLSQRANYLHKKEDVAELKEVQKEAIKNYLLALKYKPDYIDSLIAIARLYNENKNYKEAVPYAEKALKLLLENFEKSEQELIKFEDNKVSNTSRAFLEMAKNRRKNRQILIAVINYPIQILKSYYGGIEINLEKYVEIIHAEEMYFLAKEVEVLEQYQFAKETFERNKSLYSQDSKILSSIKAELDSRSMDVQKFKLEKQLSTIILLISKAEAYRNMGKLEQALKILNLAVKNSLDVLDGATKEHLLNLINMERNAHLNIADILCVMSTVNYQGNQLNLAKFNELAPQIEQELKAGQMSESEPLFQRYKDTLNRFTTYKDLASKFKEKKP